MSFCLETKDSSKLLSNWTRIPSVAVALHLKIQGITTVKREARVRTRMGVKDEVILILLVYSNHKAMLACKHVWLGSQGSQSLKKEGARLKCKWYNICKRRRNVRLPSRQVMESLL